LASNAHIYFRTAPGSGTSAYVNELKKLGIPRATRKELRKASKWVNGTNMGSKGSWGDEQDKAPGSRVLDKLIAINPNAILGCAFGTFQVLGIFLVDKFNNDPEEMYKVFQENPNDTRFGMEAFIRWVNHSYSKRFGKISADQFKKYVNSGRVDEAVSTYYGKPDPKYAANVIRHAKAFHRAAGTPKKDIPRYKNILKPKEKKKEEKKEKSV